ncbi:hypothetical protein PVMG_05329 [Plasmodium vivax Mauritania I]|uniref:Variable surface protein Vir7-like protein n=1 Tax=Plasmodium vivax Mauritania I TaxID=1035515 RepID=A0A0J9TJ68_PLAVI|nr:hypothetical protein PVMG_05329 [Plasmodium vivax Mauritania I]
MYFNAYFIFCIIVKITNIQILVIRTIHYISLDRNIYYFLKEVWKKYDDFDKPVDDDTYYHRYISICSLIVKETHENIDKEKKFCMKLVRNFGHYSENNEFLNYKSSRCLDLNNWIYNSMMKHNIPKSIITECFDEYKGTVRGMQQAPTCLDYEYDQKYAEPMKIIMLNIFESSMGTIKNIINGKMGRSNIPCRKYVCENVQIYKDMYQKYCVKKEEGNQRHENTCSKLGQFKSLYTYYFSSELGNEAEIPSLDDIQNESLTECQQYLQERALDTIVAPQVLPIYSSRTHSQDSNSDERASITLPDGENRSSAMSSTVSTALGTVAGASSILALLYKVTLIFI